MVRMYCRLLGDRAPSVSRPLEFMPRSRRFFTVILSIIVASQVISARPSAAFRSPGSDEVSVRLSDTLTSPRVTVLKLPSGAPEAGKGQMARWHSDQGRVPPPLGADMDAEWKLLSGPIDPPQTAAVVGIHDARRRRLVLVNGGNFHELWVLSLPRSGAQSWKRIPILGSVYPVERSGFSAVYDSLRDRAILFGGGPGLSSMNDVWELSLGDSPSWRPIAPQGSLPAPRSTAAAIFDPIRKRMVIFGGSVLANYEGQQYFSDTWALDFRGAPTWVQLAANGLAPGVRQAASAVYDPWGDRMLVFGGWAVVQDPQWGSAGAIYDDTWALSLSGAPQWSLITAANLPPGRQAHVAIVDPDKHRMIISGGDTWQWSRFVSDTWALPIGAEVSGENRAWAQLATTGTNPAVDSHAAIYSPERAGLLQFGGEDNGNECYELSLATLAWTQVNANAPDAFPSRRALPTLHVDAASDRLSLFGGAAWGCQHDLWAIPLDGAAAWQHLPSVGIAPVCGDANFAHDPVRHRLLAFSSDYAIGGGSMNETWALSLDEPRVWTRLGVTGPLPPGRVEFSVTYDPLRDRILLFGGATYFSAGDNNGTDRDDVWSLSLRDLTWTQLRPANSPGVRRSQWAGYDASRDRLLVVAGANAGFLDSFARYDSWALPLGADTLCWVPLGPNVPTATVPYVDPRVEAAIDPLRDRLLLWDGSAAAWSLSLADPTAWNPLTIAGEPPTPRTYFSLTYDSLHDQAVAYAGYDGAMKGDLWALRFSRPLHVQMLPVQSRVHRGDDPHAVVEAAILAERDFSPDSVRIETITLAGAHALGQQHDRGREHMADRRVEHEDEGPAWRDVNGDGRADLVLRFAAESLAVSQADSVAVLRGRTTHFEILGRARLQQFRRLPQLEAVENSVTSAQRLRLAPRSPASSTLAVSYELPATSPARLEVFDLAGRRVLARTLEDQSPGAHEVVIAERALPAGLYLVRLAQGPRAVVARAVVLR